MLKIILIIAYSLFAIVPTWISLYYTASLIVKDGNKNDLNILWYLFSLALTITMIVVAWGSSAGVFSEIELLGRPKDDDHLGLSLYAIGDAVMDFQNDVKLLACIVIAVLAPQAIAYGMCALNGCASRIMFVDACTKFLCWGVIKFFAIAAGYLLALLISSSTLMGVAWGRLGSSTVGGKILDFHFAMMLMLISVVLTLVYRRIHGIFTRLANACPEAVKAVLKLLHRWATRNI